MPLQAEKILAVRHLLPALEFIVVFTDEVPPAAVRGSHTVLRLEGVIDRGRALAADAAAVARYEAGIAAVQPDDLLTIIYTSGTTGEPKGVMLTHDNVLSNLRAVIPVLELTTEDVALSYLPLSHVFERMVTYLYLYEGVTVCHAESIDTLARDLQLVRPTVMTGVPRVYEKLYARIHDAVAAGPAFRRRLFEWAVRVGTEASAARREGRPLSPFLKMQEAVADGLVAAKIREKVGGRLRLAVSGSAPLPAHIARFFHAVGVPLIEGYGLTETSPVITVNPLHRPRFGSVGCVIDGVDVAIAEDGEIVTRGPHVMKGYWNRPEDTAAVLDADGWFHTGDIGTLERRRLPHDHRSEEGTAGHLGRQEDRARADRGAAQASPARRRGDDRRRRAQVPGRADRAQFRGPGAAAARCSACRRARATHWSNARTSCHCSTRSSRR